MGFSQQSSLSLEPLSNIDENYLAGETELVARLAERADAGDSARAKIRQTALDLVKSVRRKSANEGGIDAFLQQYDLSSEEGVLLMCIAEALLRIPDSDTADRLIADKLTSARWEEHLGGSESVFVNASTWGLMLTGGLLRVDDATARSPMRVLRKLVSSAGEPVIRTAMRQAMRIIGHQFVMGRDIDEALSRAREKGMRRFRYSYDMLGEAALTKRDADRYFEAYAHAIERIGADVDQGPDLSAAPGISVKLSALHPRYEFAQHKRTMAELKPRLLDLCVMARDAGIALTVDAEESERLELSLDVFERAYRDPVLDAYDGLGLAIQAYQRRALEVVGFIVGLAGAVGRRIPVRLVKGAYWDAEIKAAQVNGLASYPVFTRKPHTDIAYLACARTLLSAESAVYAQFATHNAHTIASVLHFAGGSRSFEFQRLHGMGEELYDDIVDPDKFAQVCRIYAPVGSHKDLLPYLVRRLLENGANTSFVNRILDESVDEEEIVADPLDAGADNDYRPHGRIPDPAWMFGGERKNSRGHNLPDRAELASLLADMDRAASSPVVAAPIVGGRRMKGASVPSVNPADTRLAVGECVQADRSMVDEALIIARDAQPAWDRTPADTRARILEQAADLYEEHTSELLALCIREAGKTLPDAIAELREAVDFLRYYAAEARSRFGDPVDMPGPTGERNRLGLRGRGVFLCISPWNFPLAIYTGQVSAALAAGNAVLAKPAEQTPLLACRATELLLEAGISDGVLHFLPGDGPDIGGYAAGQVGIDGVAFTGSTETAVRINRTLAARSGPLPALVAETGGINALFVDSSALPEQVVVDAIESAFNSAGQRCSALRLLCVQEDIADRVIELLTGHMRELSVGDPADLATDVGPVIDADARRMLEDYVQEISAKARVLHRCERPAAADMGTFVPPVAVEIDDPSGLDREIFGPVLHVYRYPARRLAEIVDTINGMGYGLTMGLHSRIDRRAREFARLSGAGNIYINRNIIGAVVGVQPFGGRGLSGTGPKAGGPGYLPRFGTEYSVSNNIAAVGGDAGLLSLDD